MFRLFKAETLIKEIESRPYIWDKNDPDYHNYPKKYTAWKEIGKIIYKNWDSSNATTRKEICNEIKKKWANIRDNYRKYLVKKMAIEQKGSDNIRRSYVYSDALKFLNPIFKSDKRWNELENLSFDDSNTAEDDEEEQAVEYLDPDENETVDRIDVLDIKLDPDETNERKRPRRDSYHGPSTTGHQSTQKTLEVDMDDDDTLFLLSFRSHMKEMDKDQKVEFKIGMLKLLKQIR